MICWYFSWFSAVPISYIKLDQISMNTVCLQLVLLLFLVVLSSTNCQYKTPPHMNTVCLQVVLICWCFSWFSPVPVANIKLQQTSTNTACLQLIFISWWFSRLLPISANNAEFHQNDNLQNLLIRPSALSGSFSFSHFLGILPSSRPHHHHYHPRKYLSNPVPLSVYSTLHNLGSW
jgi:hypothetical protein